jgi:hypothetical protein
LDRRRCGRFAPARDSAGNVIKAVLERRNARRQAITVFVQPAHGLGELPRCRLRVELACACRGEPLRAGVASGRENGDEQRGCRRGPPERHAPEAVHRERRLYALFGRCICGLRLTCHSGGSELS